MVGMDSDDLELVARLYEQHAEAVYLYALRRSNRDVADEVTARAFLVAWRRRGSIPNDALPWLYGVARRILAEERRGASRRGALRGRLGGAIVERAGDMPDVADTALAEALGRLSSSDREALLLRYWEDLSPEQVAKALGCSKATLAVRLHRARTRLSRALEAQAVAENVCTAGAKP
jgi:RNA polymerase sigma-70 factor, ECF subfamily